MWKNKTIVLEKVRAKQECIVVFHFLGEPEKMEFIPTCGCSSLSFDDETGELTVKIKFKNVPRHLLAKGYYEVTKTIKVKSKNGLDVLSIVAKVFNKV